MSSQPDLVKPRRGRRPRLTRAQVVDAALALIEARGLDELSMRRLGQTLGVEGMALYTYVSGKDALLDAVAARVLDELELPGATGDWEARIRGAVSAWAAMKHRHPRSFPLVYRRGVPTDKVARTTEYLLDALSTAGFDKAETALAYQTLVCFLDGALFAWPPESYRADEAWRNAADTIDAARFPRQHQVARHAARLRWKDVWESGLDLLLNGLRARLEKTTSGADT
jgi:TetR/AcrR family transcriptional regulator, tetracycline repressor protein